MSPSDSVRQRPDGERPEEPLDVSIAPLGKRPAASRKARDLDVFRPRWPEIEIAIVARRQLNLITRQQLFDLGLTPSDIDYSLHRQRLIRVHRGVYSLAAVLPAYARELAAVLAVGDAAFTSHASAAALWGMAPVPAGDVHVTVVNRDAGRRRAGITVHQTTALETTVRHSVPVTTPARTLLDIAPDLGDHELERAFDSGLKTRLFTRDGVATLAHRHVNRPGASRLKALAAAELRVTRITRSWTERRMITLARDAGLPVPEVNATLGRFVVDFLWRAERVIVETDGYEFHSTRRSFESDHERDLALRDAGYTVLRFTRDQLADRPERVLASLVRALDRAAVSLAGRAGR
jgi:very-short-patch-repair endonuclease